MTDLAALARAHAIKEHEMTDTPEKLLHDMAAALRKAQRALDGVIRSAGQSVAGFLAGRRQVAAAEITASDALARYDAYVESPKEPVE